MSGSGISWVVCKSAPCSRQIPTPTPHHSFLQAGCPSCHPTNSVIALKAILNDYALYKSAHELARALKARGMFARCWRRWWWRSVSRSCVWACRRCCVARPADLICSTAASSHSSARSAAPSSRSASSPSPKCSSGCRDASTDCAVRFAVTAGRVLRNEVK